MEKSSKRSLLLYQQHIPYECPSLPRIVQRSQCWSNGRVSRPPRPALQGNASLGHLVVVVSDIGKEQKGLAQGGRQDTTIATGAGLAGLEMNCWGECSFVHLLRSRLPGHVQLVLCGPPSRKSWRNLRSEGLGQVLGTTISLMLDLQQLFWLHFSRCQETGIGLQP